MAVMAATLKEQEAVPDAAKALDHRVIWARIEAWCSVRWTPRTVVWIADGGGDWEPPLEPATIQKVEVWQGQSWIATAPWLHPLGGLHLSRAGPYRITATVGEGPAPAAAIEAFKRLANYMAEKDEHPGSSSVNEDLGPMRTEVERAPIWLARAIHYSGAADMLRPYRRAR